VLSAVWRWCRVVATTAAARAKRAEHSASLGQYIFFAKLKVALELTKGAFRYGE